jgi:hypothetical protein
MNYEDIWGRNIPEGGSGYRQHRDLEVDLGLACSRNSKEV